MEDTTATHTAPPTDPNHPPPTLPPEALAFATRVYNAARTGDLPLFEQALPAGLPPNMTNEKGDSLIMLSAYHGHPALVRLLLSHNADPNSLNDRMQSPLAGAVFKHEEEVVEALLEGGADPECGEPSASEAARIFGMEERWGERFRGARGRGSVRKEGKEEGVERRGGVGGQMGAKQPL